MSETIRFPVAGMTCGTCVARIDRAVRRLAGVSKVRVDLRRETATVRRDPTLATDPLLAAAIEAAGYAADVNAAEVLPEATWASPFSRLLGRR